MPMPYDVVLVRHGESEGNIAGKASKKNGDDSHYTPEFMNRHNSLWRLSDKGICDAQAAGVWLREHMPLFDRYYTSPYLRAMETAGLLGLEGAKWYQELHLRERDRGWLDVVPHSLLKTQFADELRRWKQSTLFWKPPGGESMADVCMRVNRVFDTLRRDCSEKRIIIVCHGEVMWAFRMELERMSQKQWVELDASEDQAHKIYNGQIIHYTRRDPQTDSIESHFNWMRMIRAEDETFSRKWHIIERRKLTNDDLLVAVRDTPRLVSK